MQKCNWFILIWKELFWVTFMEFSAQLMINISNNKQTNSSFRYLTTQDIYSLEGIPFAENFLHINLQILMNNNILTFQQTQVLQPAKNDSSQPQQSPFDKSYFLCFILYFLQGNVISIGQTMPYLYKQLPSYKTLALFSTIDLPFSFKFMLSPFLEKYTNLTYGKRKTWIIISQLICSAILLVTSFFTEVTFASLIAILLMSSELFLTIQDISLDSLSIKEMRSPERASMIQSIAQPFGIVIGSLILLKFTSSQFAGKIGLSQAITTPTLIIRVISTFLILTALLMHLLFRETALECERKGKEKTFCQIVSYSKTFLHLKSKYCRTIIFLLIYYQGLKFYEAGYDYQLIKSGFSRDTSNSISNLIALPVIALTFYMTSLINKMGLQPSLIVALLAQCCLYTFNILVFSHNPHVIIVTQFIAQILITYKNMVLYIMINSFPLHGLSGMFITIMLSVWNLGDLKTLNTLIIDIFGWKNCALFGVGLQLVIICYLPSIISWINQGIVEIDSSISEDEDYSEYPAKALAYEPTDAQEASFSEEES